MEGYRKRVQEGKAVFVGVDLHRFKWQVTVRTEDDELFSGTIPAHWEALRRLLDRVRVQNRIKSELQFFGVELVGPRAPWPRAYVERLWSASF